MERPKIAWRARLLRWVGSVPLLSHLLRRFARRFPEGSEVRIGSGLAKGLRWKRHARYVNGYWLGHYELDIQGALERLLRPGQTFFDVGANAGFFAIIGGRLVGAGGTVVALDPDPDNTSSIREQCELNEMNQVHVVCAAAADEPGTASFARASAGCSMGHLGDARTGEEQLEVAVTTLDAIARERGVPDLVKLDVEGAEASALRGARTLLDSGRVAWLIELHGPACENDVRALLTTADYRLEDLGGTPLAPETAWPHHIVALPGPA